MPDPTFRAMLPTIAKRLDARTNGGLWGLALVCRDFNFINDALLREMAPYVTKLKRLQLVGHTKVTREGVYAVLEVAPELEELVLDAPPHSVSPRPRSLQGYLTSPPRRSRLGLSPLASR